MVLFLHISCALGSLLFASYSVLRPSLVTIRISFVGMLLTIGSGVYITIISHAHILSVCISGLAYVGAVSALLSVARTRLNRY